jgi:hypothetical protein
VRTCSTDMWRSSAVCSLVRSSAVMP